jgi:hypothetical protein
MCLVEKRLRQLSVESAAEKIHDIREGGLRGNEVPRRLGRDQAESQGLTSQAQRYRKARRGTRLVARIDEVGLEPFRQTGKQHAFEAPVGKVDQLAIVRRLVGQVILGNPMIQ